MSFTIESPEHNTSASNFGPVSSFVLIKTTTENKMDKKWCVEPVFMPAAYGPMADAIYQMDVRPDDTWIISFPKSGTIWTLEMVWLLANDLDFTKATQIVQHDRCHFIERSILNVSFPNSLENTIAAPSPRFIMTHIPAPLLPKALWTVRPKIVYVARNPKDVVVSQYYFFTNLRGWHGRGFDEFVELFVNDTLPFAPFHSHIRNFWNMKSEENICFITYEEMKSNMIDVLKRMAAFLGKSFDDIELRQLEHYLSFDQMKMNNAVNRIHMSVDGKKDGYKELHKL